jgi:sugar phosphate isomerase/epimerase
LVDLRHMALVREDPDVLELLADSIIHVHFSDQKSLDHTNQVIGTGTTHTVDYLNKLRQLDIDGRLQRFGYDELVGSLELGVPADVIHNSDQSVQNSIQYIMEIAPFMTL